MSGSYNAPLSQTALLMQQAQENFLRGGGIYAPVLTKLQSDGVLTYQLGQFHEYPKMLYIHTGEVTTNTYQTEDVKGKVHTWTKEEPVVNKVLVNSEEEEERVLNGGKTAAAIEDERQTLLIQAKARGVKYDPSWSLLRLQRELGVATNVEAPPGVYDELEELRQQVARAEEALRLKRQLADLHVQLSKPDGPPPVEADSVEGMRAELQALGVKPDGRWTPVRLRQELEAARALEAATAPSEAAD